VTDIWSHLGTLYDLQALNDSESLRYPDVDFLLPEDILAELKEKPFPRLVSSGVHEESVCNQDETAGTDSGSDRETVELKPAHTSSKTSKNTNDNNSDKALTDKFVDSPAKSDNRKRTRHSVGVSVPSGSPMSSPATARVSGSGTVTETGSSTSKRSRRI